MRRSAKFARIGARELPPGAESLFGLAFAPTERSMVHAVGSAGGSTRKPSISDREVARPRLAAPSDGIGVPDFSNCAITWTEHALKRSAERGVSPQEAEVIIRTSVDQEQNRRGRLVVWGCVRGQRTKIVLLPVASLCLVITLIRTVEPCI